MKAERIDHICIAVKDLDQARKVYEDLLELEPAVEYVAESESIRVIRYYVGEVAIELMESTTPEGKIAKFITQRGEGLYLISYKVADVAAGINELKAKGKQLIDETPRHLTGNRYAFVMPPGETCGILTEIIDGEFALKA